MVMSTVDGCFKRLVPMYGYTDTLFHEPSSSTVSHFNGNPRRFDVRVLGARVDQRGQIMINPVHLLVSEMSRLGIKFEPVSHDARSFHGGQSFHINAERVKRLVG